MRKRRRIKKNETALPTGEGPAAPPSESPTAVVRQTTGLKEETLAGDVMTIVPVARHHHAGTTLVEGGTPLVPGSGNSPHMNADLEGPDHHLVSVVPVRNHIGRGAPARIAVHRLMGVSIFPADMALMFRTSNYFFSRKSRESLSAGFSALSTREVSRQTSCFSALAFHAML